MYSSLNSESDFDDRDCANDKYYAYTVKSERKNKSTLLHVYLTETPFSKRAGFADKYNRLSQPEKDIEDTYHYRISRLTERDYSQRVIAEFDEIAALIE